MELKNNQFQKVEYHAGSSMIVSKWKPETENMSNDEFLKDAKEFAGYVVKFKPKRYLNLMKEFKYSIVPEMQKDIDDNVVAMFAKNGMKKIASVMPTELFPSASLEQLIKEEQSKNLKSLPFDDEEKAREWLLE